MSFRFECINNYTIWTDHLLCEPYLGFIYFSQSRVWLLFGSILWSSVLSNYPCCVVWGHKELLRQVHVSFQQPAWALMMSVWRSCQLPFMCWFILIEITAARWKFFAFADAGAILLKKFFYFSKKKEILLMLLTLSVVLVQYNNPFFQL